MNSIGLENIFRILMNQMTIPLLTCLALASIGVCQETYQEKSFGTIHVKDFGAIPGDGQCDSVAIQEAIDFATTNSVGQISFDAGQYDLKIGTEKNAESGSCYLLIQNAMDRLKLQGEVDKVGRPATWLVRENPCNDKELPSILITYRCKGITLENLGFDNSPYYYSAGKVVESGKGALVVDILPGHPVVDGMESFQMGIYDLEKRELLDGKLSFRSEGKWRKTSGSSDRRMKLMSNKASQSAEPGDCLFWFFTNYGGKQVFFDETQDLILRNLWTPSSSGMVFYFRYCRNIFIDRVAIKPDEDRIVTAPRDGLHFRECSGLININNLEIEGTCDDGINVHGQFYRVGKRSEESSLRIRALNESSFPLKPGSKIGFFDGPAIRHFGTIQASEFIEETSDHIVQFAEPLPGWIKKGHECVPYATLPACVSITDSTFRNISTCGIIIKSDNTTVSDCHFHNIERLGVLVLCSFHNPAIGMMEPSAAKNVLIRDSLFDNCGREYRSGEMGGLAAIATDVGRRNGASIENVRIISNTFQNIPNNCINIMDARDVLISENRFIDLPEKKLVFVDEYSEEVSISNNSR